MTAIEGEGRRLGKTGYTVQPIGIGTWSMGGSWGPTNDAASLDALALAVAVEQGVDFFDTADNYGDGRSERLLGRLLRSVGSKGLRVATKMGRRASAPEYTLDNFRRWTDASRERLGVDALDLIQLHCPPATVYDDSRVFDALQALVEQGGVRHVGVSVQSVAQGIRCLEYPCVATLQVVFNIFRPRPAWVAAASLPPLTRTSMDSTEEVYRRLIHPQIAGRW